MKDKIKLRNEIMEDLKDCEEDIESLEAQKKYYQKQLFNQKKLKSLKKQGNFFLIVAAVMVVVLIVLIFTVKTFSSGDFWTLGMYTISPPLLLGVILKCTGMKNYRRIIQEAEGMDAESISKELESIDEELKELTAQKETLTDEINEILEYTGDNWILKNLGPSDTDEFPSIEKDFADVVEKVFLREDEEFLCYNWVSVNFANYAYAVGRDDSTEVFEYESVFRLMQDSSQWRLRLLGEMMPLAADELLLHINHQRPRVSLGEACRKTGILEHDGADPEFFEQTVIAFQKMVNAYAKEVFEWRRENAANR